MRPIESGERGDEIPQASTRHGIPVAPALMRVLDQLANEWGIVGLAGKWWH